MKTVVTFDFDQMVNNISPVVDRETPTLQQLLSEGPVERYDERFLRTVPKQPRARQRLKALVEMAEALYNHPLIGRDNLSIGIVQRALEAKAIHAEDHELPDVMHFSIGIMYRIFEHDDALLNYIAPYRDMSALPPHTTNDSL